MSQHGSMTPEEVEVGRRNLIAELRDGEAGGMDVSADMARDLIAVLEAGPSKSGRAGIKVTDGAVEAATQRLDEYYDFEIRGTGVAAKLVLEAAVPHLQVQGVPVASREREALIRAGETALDGAACICPRGRNQYGGWYSPQPTCPRCGDARAKSTTVVVAVLATSSMPPVRSVRSCHAWAQPQRVTTSTGGSLASARDWGWIRRCGFRVDPSTLTTEETPPPAR